MEKDKTDIQLPTEPNCLSMLCKQANIPNCLQYPAETLQYTTHIIYISGMGLADICVSCDVCRNFALVIPPLEIGSF